MVVVGGCGFGFDQDTGEICALKKMKKKTLFKMDEVGICTLGLYARPYLTRL